MEALIRELEQQLTPSSLLAEAIEPHQACKRSGRSRQRATLLMTMVT